MTKNSFVAEVALKYPILYLYSGLLTLNILTTEKVGLNGFLGNLEKGETNDFIDLANIAFKIVHPRTMFQGISSFC